MGKGTLYLYGVPASTFDNMLYREALELKAECVEYVITFIQLYPPNIRDASRLNACLKARKHNYDLLHEKDE